MSATLMTGFGDRPWRCPKNEPRSLCSSLWAPIMPLIMNLLHRVDEIVTYGSVLFSQGPPLTNTSQTQSSCDWGGAPKSTDVPVNRLERRKQRTRAALIKAAQAFIAAGKGGMFRFWRSPRRPMWGMDSIYNHFDKSKENSLPGRLRRRGARCGMAHCSITITASIDDPAETFACSFRLTGRLFLRRSKPSHILRAYGMAHPPSSDLGLAPRALRDIESGGQRGPAA